MTVTPAPSESTPRNAAFVWMLLVAYLVATKLILDRFLPHAFADPAQAAVFGWQTLALISALGLVGAWLSERTGFAPAWAGRSSWRDRVRVPLLVGAVFGAAQIGLDLATGYTKLVAARHGVTQQYTDFPSMLAIFTAAPIVVEVVYRLLVIPLALWLLSGVLLRGRGETRLFWILALLSSALEPFGQAADLQVLPAGIGAALVAEYFLLNLTQAAFFRRRGFLAAIMVRVGFYLVWHVLYVH